MHAAEVGCELAGAFVRAADTRNLALVARDRELLLSDVENQPIRSDLERLTELTGIHFDTREEDTRKMNTGHDKDLRTGGY